MFIDLILDDFFFGEIRDNFDEYYYGEYEERILDLKLDFNFLFLFLCESLFISAYDEAEQDD